MHPVIDLFGFDVGAYRSMTIIALAAGIGLTVWIARHDGLASRTVAAFVTATVAGALVGGRVFAAATAADPFVGDPGRLFALRFGAMAMFGGIGGAAVGGIAMARWSGEPAERLADIAAPAIALGIAVLRVGCLLAGCCFGTETGLPWAITYPEDSVVHLHQRADSLFSLFDGPHGVHPIPVYEIVAAGALFGVAMWLRRRPVRTGTAFAVVVGGYALTRLAIQPLRAPEPGSTPAWFDPVLFATVALAAAIWLAAPRLRTTAARPLGV